MQYKFDKEQMDLLVYKACRLHPRIPYSDIVVQDFTIEYTEGGFTKIHTISEFAGKCKKYAVSKGYEIHSYLTMNNSISKNPVGEAVIFKNGHQVHEVKNITDGEEWATIQACMFVLELDIKNS